MEELFRLVTGKPNLQRICLGVASGDPPLLDDKCAVEDVRRCHLEGAGYQRYRERSDPSAQISQGSSGRLVGA